MGVLPIPASNKSGIYIRDSVRFGDKEIPFGITYSRKRKTVAIVIHHTQKIEVKAPAGVPLPAIRDTVLKKSPWILKKLAVFAETGAREITRSYSSGEPFPFLGNIISLEIVRENTARPVRNSGSILTVAVPRNVPDERVQDFARKQVLAWYRNQAVLVIREKVSHFSSRLNIPAPEFRVRNIRKRWGSCSHDDHLNFNIRLIMAPESQVDYVVLHELCHILHKDHQARFWSDIAREMPDYKQRKDSLKRDGWTYVL